MAILISRQPVPDISRIWFEGAHIRYADYYLRLYIAFNAWYQHVCDSTNDRVALNYLQQRTDMWERFWRAGRPLVVLSYLEHFVELTQRQPLPPRPHWDGSIRNKYDWPSLVESWYQIRCITVHGDEIGEEYLFYAYHTLRLFLEEVLSSPPWLMSSQPGTSVCDIPHRTNTSLLLCKKTV